MPAMLEVNAKTEGAPRTDG